MPGTPIPTYSISLNSKLLFSTTFLQRVIKSSKIRSALLTLIVGVDSFEIILPFSSTKPTKIFVPPKSTPK